MNLKYFIVFVAGMAALAGCQEASEYIPSIYITEAQRQEVKTITISQAGEKAEFTVSAAQIVDRDTHVSFEACPELVADYNDRYGRTAVALEDFTFAKKEVVIAAGKNVSESVEVVVNEELKPGTFYCLPVKIASTDGGMSILESSSKLFLVFRAPVRSKAVYIGSGNKCFVPTFPEHPSFEGLNLETMQEVTLECRVMVNSFTKSDPYISSIMGFEGDVCMRFGDVKIGYDVLQVCKGDYQPAAINSPCAPNLWYHVAAVWSRSTLRVYIDGKFVAEQTHKGETVNLAGYHKLGRTGIGFSLGAASVYNNNRPLNGYLAEARVWSRALSSNEIANNKDLVVVDPQSPGLLAKCLKSLVETRFLIAFSIIGLSIRRATDMMPTGKEEIRILLTPIGKRHTFFRNGPVF